jgi:hypothetical protein
MRSYYAISIARDNEGSGWGSLTTLAAIANESMQWTELTVALETSKVVKE